MLQLKEFYFNVNLFFLKTYPYLYLVVTHPCISDMSGNQSSVSDNLSLFKSTDFQCFLVMPASAVYTAFFMSNILILLPLCIFIIYLGVRRWQRQRSSAMMISPLDCISYHVVTMELFGFLGEVICSCGIYIHNLDSVYVGWGLWSFSWHGETFFNILTCLEHYLAVVHPITYLRLKRIEGHRIRNVTSCCVWLLSLGLVFLILDAKLYLSVSICILITSVIVISFCSVSVLYCLIRPRPGEQRVKRERVDQSKRRAFFAIMLILATLLIRCILNLVWSASLVAGGQSACVSMAASTWSNVPGSLVLPLLFIYRAEVFTCRKN